MKTLLAVLLSVLIIMSQDAAATEPVGDGIAPMNAADLRVALQKLRVTGTVMYVAAHPDDENTALLAYFAKGKKYRTVYLSLTRGEGGQNILGPEKDADLGIIRTQELLDARRVDGAEQMFSRAVDFGFSKSSVETIAMWGRDAIVSDIVWAIRSVRPDIIITRFSPTEGGHGNHTASAILAAEAFARSGDSSWYPSQRAFVKPWKAKQLLFNRLTGFGGTPGTKEPGDKAVDVGAYNPLLGISYTEIAGLSRSLHKTQAMGSELRRGKNLALFRVTEIDSMDALMRRMRDAKPAGAAGSGQGDDDLFSGIETSWKRYGAGEIDQLLMQADRNFDPEHPERILPALLRVNRQLALLASSTAHASDPLIRRKRAELTAVITACIGLNATAHADRQRVAPGERVGITVDLIARAGVPMVLGALRSTLLRIDTALNARMQSDVKQQIKLVASIPASMAPTQPYWLQTLSPSLTLRANGFPEHAAHSSATSVQEAARISAVDSAYAALASSNGFHYMVPAQTLTGLPENPDSLSILCDLTVAGERISLTLPVHYLSIDPIAGEVHRPVAVVPAIDIACVEKMEVWTQPGEKPVLVRVRSTTGTERGAVRLVLPPGFHASPSSIPFEGIGPDEARTFSFAVRADSTSASGIIAAEAVTAGRTYDMHGIDLAYPHIVPQRVMHPAQLKAVRADIRIVKSRIGFIAGSGDEVPEGLRQCGYEVVTIDDDSLQAGSLASFDAIVVGVRAYNVRPQVRQSHPRLMEYVRAGGTLLVQYQTPGRESEAIGPYPFRISRARVTDETADMTEAYADPSAPGSDSTRRQLVRTLMHYPNVLGQQDFDGWVQERGLYFADTWDDRYAAPFICSDPGEAPQQGSLLIAPSGNGVYCYTGLSFFRQLPAGVAGAFRLLCNLLELKQQR